MKKIVLGAVALSLVGSTGAFAARQALGVPHAERTPVELYPRLCGYCHGHNVGPLILGRQLPVDLVTTIVRQGRGAMPAFRPTEISPSELAALTKWIEASKANPVEKGQ